MDEKTREMVRSVAAEWTYARETLLKMDPGLKEREMELIEATRTVVVEVNDFKTTEFIQEQRSSGRGESSLSPKQINALKRNNLWVEGMSYDEGKAALDNLFNGGSSPTPAPAPAPTNNYGNNAGQKYQAQCAGCGQMTELPFKPTGSRPVYCVTCFRARNPR